MEIEKEFLNSLLDFVHKEVLNGGTGSGDFDHAGRPGLVGGSEPAGTGRNGKYEDGIRQWVGAKSSGTNSYKKAEKKEETKTIETEKQAKEVKKEEKTSNFGAGVKIKELEQKGQFATSKKLKSYEKGDRTAIVDDFSSEGKERFLVSFAGQDRKRIRKTYSTRQGMEKAVKEYLNPNVEEKQALSISEAEKKYKEALTAKRDNERALNAQEFMSEEWLKLANKHHINKLNKAITDSRREYAESIMDNFKEADVNPYAEKVEARREYYKQKGQEAREKSDKLLDLYDQRRLPFGQPIVNPKTARHYEKQRALSDKALSEYDKSKYYAEKGKSFGTHGISSDDANAIAKLSAKYKRGVTSAEKRRIIDRVIELHRNMQVATISKPNEDFSHLGFNVERNADLNRLQLKFRDIPDADTRSVLKRYGFRWSPSNKAWQRQSGANAEASLRRVADLLSKNK